MSGKIFLLQENEKLQALSAKDYESEALLQGLLAEYPDLLAGDQINPTRPRRWLLVKKEMGVPAEKGGTDQWWLDHIFLDQDAIPTLVEVKRKSDTRIRREVVGQMLDYAANAVVYWPVESIRVQFEATCEKRGDDPTALVAELLQIGPEGENAVEVFWERVKTNLQAERIRLVFVADEIPPELKRIVEFLNGQMDPAEVLAIEIKQYVGSGVKTLVPRVIGQTAEAQRAKVGAGQPGRQWDEPSFLEDLKRGRNPEEAQVANKILRWARQHKMDEQWGRGKVDGSFVPVLKHAGREHKPFAMWSSGSIQLYFAVYQSKPPFDSEEQRREIQKQLNAISDVAISDNEIDKYPSIPLAVLTDEAKLQQFLAVFDWFLQEVKAT